MRKLAALAIVIISTAPAPAPVGAQVGVAAPSILPMCMEPPDPQRPNGFGVGPSARARECTRQMCADPSMKVIVRWYAMREAQTKDEEKLALTCITRAEQDTRVK